LVVFYHLDPIHLLNLLGLDLHHLLNR
jgi:hypothetical protein